VVTLSGIADATYYLMKAILYLPVFAVVSVLSITGCGSSGDNRPIPGTVEATDTKKDAAQNNTPRTNPTPNPEPASQPPDSVQAR
jgi:hypothetical protein